MKTFNKYAEFYDLLYNDKDYQSEASFVERLLDIHTGSCSHILEIGCGTGGHALHLVQHGFHIFGIDISHSMIEVANRRLLELPQYQQHHLRFEQKDIRTLDLGIHFSAAIALFHVMSYLTTDADLNAAILSVRKHLSVGCPFIFDFWHAPAVLNDTPKRREKVTESDKWHIHRITEPVWDKNSETVRVNFRVIASNKNDSSIRKFQEEHVMRYFNTDTMEMFLRNNGFELVQCGEWLTETKPNSNSFGVYMVAKAV